MDLLVLDVEGAELDILEHFDFEKFTIDVSGCNGLKTGLKKFTIDVRHMLNIFVSVIA